MSPDCMAASPRRTKGAVREKMTPALRWIPISQSQSLAEFLGLYPPLLWEIGIHLSAGVVFSLTAPFVLRGLAAMQAGLIHGMLSWRSEVSRLEQMARY